MNGLTGWIATTLMLMLLWTHSAARVPVDETTAKSSDQTSRFIVHLSYPPLALFDAEAAQTHPKLAGLLPVNSRNGRLRLDTPEAESYRGELAAQQARVLDALARYRGKRTPATRAMDVALNALVLDLTPAQATWLAQQPEVQHVEPDWVARPQTDAGPSWISANMLWDGSAGATTRGEGVVVGVIDTGINPTHPSFAASGPLDGYVHQNPRPNLVTICNGGNSPCNAKLIGIRDFTSGSSSAEPDNGLDVDGHGSHVASTALGNALEVTLEVGSSTVLRTVSGVAPHANLISYKACEQEADCLGSWLLAAINEAVGDGVDVINYSIGGSPRSPWTASDAQAMAAARAAGIVVVVSAGNEGPSAGSLSAPANAPWVLAVANATHNRTVGNRLLDFSGGSGAAPGGGSLLGAGNTAGFGPASIVIPQDFPGCGTGDGLGLGANGQPDGSSNPWADQPNRFNGEIVVCLRGTQARIAKSDNVRRAGAGGMVLLNGIGDGESIAADSHSLPATHLGFADAELLRQWLAAGGQRGRIEGALLTVENALGDRLAASSGRGPVDIGALMKPNITAPGTSILAAAGTGNGIVSQSGTSMAAPHVTGAVALLRSARPAWSVSQIESALQTTALNTIRLQNGVTPAGPLAAGAGRVNLATALGGGLYLDVNQSAFQSANPASGGNPGGLNLPGIVMTRCLDTCSAQRTVRDQIGGGRWRVESSISEGSIRVTPAEFTLAAGASMNLSVVIDVVGVANPGRWIDGEIRLVPVAGSAAVTRLPVTAYADPGEINAEVRATVSGDAGFVDLLVGADSANLGATSAQLAASLPEMSDATFLASDWGPPQVTTIELAQDPTPSAVYDGFGTGIAVQTVSIPAAVGAVSTWRLRVATHSTSAVDVDLYVGNDIDGDGLPAEAEELCQSTGGNAEEVCDTEIQQTGSAQTLWILVQNWQAGGAGLDAVSVDQLAFDTLAPPSSIAVATGPAQVLRSDAYKVRLAWDDPDWLPGQSRRTVLTLRTRPDVAAFAHVPVTLSRAVNDASAARALISGVPVHMSLAAGQSHEKLFIDVPSGSTGLQVTQSGTGNVHLYLAREQGSSGPAIASAPARTAATASHTGSGANASFNLTGTSLSPGRWYLTPVNAGAEDARITVQANLSRTVPMPVPRYGAFYNPLRSGSGLFLYPLSGQWGVIWYTYLEDGTPSWYIAAGPQPSANASSWQAPVTRHVWNGSVDRGTVVGSMQLSVLDADQMQFSFDLDGVTGSERLVSLPLAGCASVAGQQTSLDGFWYDPTFPGFGYTLVAGSEAYSIAVYLYDRNGMPRWMLGAEETSTNPLSLLQFSGFCPTCAYVAPGNTAGGSALLALGNANAAQVGLAAEWSPPLTGRWSIDHAVIKLSDALQCNSP